MFRRIHDHGHLTRYRGALVHTDQAREQADNLVRLLDLPRAQVLTHEEDEAESQRTTNEIHALAAVSLPSKHSEAEKQGAKVGTRSVLALTYVLALGYMRATRGRRSRADADSCD